MGDILQQTAKFFNAFFVSFVAFPGAWRVAGGEMFVLEGFCRFEVRSHVENGFFLKSFALVALIYACIQESYFFI